MTEFDVNDQPWVDVLRDAIARVRQPAEQPPGSVTVTYEQARAALAELDAAITHIAEALQVEFVGPEVGLDGHNEAYRLVVRAHEWEAVGTHRWSVKICDGLANAGLRATWALQGAGRRRQVKVLEVLPQFLEDYRAAAAQRDLTDHGAFVRLDTLARALRG